MSEYRIYVRIPHGCPPNGCRMDARIPHACPNTAWMPEYLINVRIYTAWVPEYRINVRIPRGCRNTALTSEYRMNVRMLNVKTRLADALRQLEGSKAVEDALQSELNTTLAAYAQSKEGNQKLIQVKQPLYVRFHRGLESERREGFAVVFFRALVCKAVVCCSLRYC